MMVMAKVCGQQGKAPLTCAYRHQRQGAENSLSVTRFVFLSFKLIFIEIEARCLFSPRIGGLKSFPALLIKGQRKTKLRNIEGIRHHIGSHHHHHQEEKEEKEDERRKRVSTTVGELVES